MSQKKFRKPLFIAVVMILAVFALAALISMIVPANAQEAPMILPETGNPLLDAILPHALLLFSALLTAGLTYLGNKVNVFLGTSRTEKLKNTLHDAIYSAVSSLVYEGWDGAESTLRDHVMTHLRRANADTVRDLVGVSDDNLLWKIIRPIVMGKVVQLKERLGEAVPALKVDGARVVHPVP